MILFDKTSCCDVCLLNTNAYMRLAASAKRQGLCEKAGDQL